MISAPITWGQGVEIGLGSSSRFLPDDLWRVVCVLLDIWRNLPHPPPPSHPPSCPPEVTWECKSCLKAYVDVSLCCFSKQICGGKHHTGPWSHCLNKWMDRKWGGGSRRVKGPIRHNWIYSCGLSLLCGWSGVMYVWESPKETIVGVEKNKQTNVMWCLCCSQCCHFILMLNWALSSSLHTDELLIRDELGMKSHGNMYEHCQYMEALKLFHLEHKQAAEYLFLACFCARSPSLNPIEFTHGELVWLDFWRFVHTPVSYSDG